MLILDKLKLQASGLIGWFIEAPLTDAGMRNITGATNFYFTVSHCSCLTRALEEEEEELVAINTEGLKSFH